MPEPIEPRQHKPAQGGWPQAVMRFDLPPGISVDLAAYELCRASRRFCWPTTALVGDLPMIAFPHETADDVARGYLRQSRMLADEREEARIMVRAGESVTSWRWTPARKEALLLAILGGEVAMADAQRLYGLSGAELDAWSLAYRARGIEGLRASAVRA